MSFSRIRQLRYPLLILIMWLTLTDHKCLAGDPGYIKLNDNKPFFISAGGGYGMSNNPCRNCAKSTIGGITFSATLGYRINNSFKIEFGPSFWIEGNDLFNDNVSDAERPNNKRTVVTFIGTWSPFRMVPIGFKLGGGAGILNYTPEKSTVKSQENKFDETEIFKGWSGVFGITYEIKLNPKLTLNPSANFWYIQLQQPEIEYESYIDYHSYSITTDLRLNLHYIF